MHTTISQVLHRTRRLFILVLLPLALMLATPQQVHAGGMPVIDIQQILTSIQNFVQQMQQWNREIQKWAEEAQRIATASKSLAEGDWRGGVDGLLDSATSVVSTVGGKISGTAGIEAMQALNSAWGTSTGIIDYLDRVDQDAAWLSDYWNRIDYDFSSTSSAWGSIADLSEDFARIYDSANDMVLDATDTFATNLVLVSGDIAAAAAEAAGIPDLMKQEQEALEADNRSLAEKYAELQGAISRGETDTVTGLQTEIDGLKNSIANHQATIENLSLSLKNSLDSEDKALRRKGELLSRQSARLQTQYQQEVIDRMTTVGKDGQVYARFYESVVENELDGNGKSVVNGTVSPDVVVNNLELYMEMLNDYRTQKAEEKAGAGNGGTK